MLAHAASMNARIASNSACRAVKRRVTRLFTREAPSDLPGSIAAGRNIALHAAVASRHCSTPRHEQQRLVVRRFAAAFELLDRRDDLVAEHRRIDAAAHRRLEQRTQARASVERA